jgi:ABC-2 type transport system permease protein
VVDKTNLSLAGVQQPAVTYASQSTDVRQSRYIDFALPGQIGFSLLSTAIFGTVFGFIALKRELVLKRMFATPTRGLTLLLAQGASRLFFALMQTAVILLMGVLVFHFYLPHGWITLIEMLVLSTIGLIAFLGFGFFMAGLANDENSASPLVNLVTLPQFLLSGVFFSADNFPNWVQPIAQNLPLSYFNVAMRKITTEGLHLVDAWPYLLGLLLWGIIMYIAAARTFRWE